MAYIASSNVFVFPSARRAQQEGGTYDSARLIGEKSVVDIYKHIVSTDSYIISESYADTMEFILGGYYFKVSGLTTFLSGNDFSSATEIWASIVLDEDTDFPEITGEDPESGTDSGKYTGLNITASAPSTVGVIKMKLLSREESTDSWSIVADNTKRFYYTQIYFSDSDIIDGGIVGLQTNFTPVPVVPITN